jgi:hypothetical protein
MNPSSLLALPLSLAFTVSLPAAVIVGDSRLVTGADQIDPPGGRNDLNLTATGTGVATKAGLIAVNGYATIQSFTGLDPSVGTAPNATGSNIFTFENRPDMRISFVGEPGRNAGSGTGTGAAYTSGPASPLSGESIFFGTSASNRMTIEFGTWDGSAFTANASVAAAGFTFSRNTAASNPTTWKVFFYDGETLLSEQSVVAGLTQTVATLFGYIAGPEEAITRIVIGGIGSGAAYDDKNHFVDDIGFAVVPEPSVFSMLAGIGALGLATTRRRRV